MQIPIHLRNKIIEIEENCIIIILHFYIERVEKYKTILPVSIEFNGTRQLGKLQFFNVGWVMEDPDIEYVCVKNPHFIMFIYAKL